MSWVYIGLLAGSIVTSTHDTKEACEGRGVTLKEKGVAGQCISTYVGGSVTSLSSTSLTCSYGNGLVGPCK